ncbi:MAG: tetratricopeptide repeat protein [Acidobacteriota bacterium]
MLAAILIFTWLMPQSDQLAEQSRRAQEALESGDFQEAVTLYQELVKALPGVPGLKMNLGISLHMAGDFHSAIQELQAAVGADEKLVSGWLFLGSSYLQAGQPRKAIQPLERYLKEKPGEPQVHKILAEAFLSLEDYEKAIEHFGKLSDLDASDAGAWYGLGKSYEALAARAFGSLQAQAPESAYWFALVADSRVAQQQYRSAFYFYRKALENNPSMRGIHVALSRIYRQTDHPEWAAEEEKKELELGLPDCQSEKLVCDFLQGRLQQVAEAAGQSNSPEAYYWQAQAYNQLAMQSFSRLAQYPSSFEMHRFKAEIHENQGEYLEAAHEWRKALEASPRNPIALQGLAVSLYLHRDYEAAQPLIDELLKSAPNSAQLNYLAGGILLNQQKAQEAVPVLEKALKTNPDLLAAHQALGRAYLSLQKSDAAIPHLEAALKGDSDGSLHYQLARAYQNSGRAEHARQILEKYQQIQQKAEAEQAQLEEEAQITPPD